MLFEGDKGTLDIHTREVLIRLLMGPYLERSQSEKLWFTLIDQKEVLDSRLCELFLRLYIDEALGVAFVKQREPGEHDIPLLLRRFKMTFLDSVLMLFLREKVSDFEAIRERAVVSDDEMVARLELLDSAQNRDKAAFQKKISNTILRAKKNGFLKKLRGSDEERYEISAIIKTVFDGEHVAKLLKRYEELLTREDTALEAVRDDDSEEVLQ